VPLAKRPVARYRNLITLVADRKGTQHERNSWFYRPGHHGARHGAQLLKAGFSVRVWNPTPARMDELAAEGATTAADPASLAGQVDVLITCVSDTPDVEAVLVGDNPPGAIHGLRPGSLVIDMSTISPHATRALAEQLQAKGVDMLDAPVSGGSEGAARGTLTIMVGGGAEQVARARPVFEAWARPSPTSAGMATARPSSWSTRSWWWAMPWP